MRSHPNLVIGHSCTGPVLLEIIFEHRPTSYVSGRWLGLWVTGVTVFWGALEGVIPDVGVKYHEKKNRVSALKRNPILIFHFSQDYRSSAAPVLARDGGRMVRIFFCPWRPQAITA